MKAQEEKRTVLSLFAGDSSEPDYKMVLAELKIALGGYAASIKRGTPKNELRRAFLEQIAGLDGLFLHGGGEKDARIVRLLAVYHSYLFAYLTVQNMSDDEAMAMARDISEIKIQTSPRAQVRNSRHAERLEETRRNKAKKNPGGQPKGESRLLKAVMRAIQGKKNAYAKDGGNGAGVAKLIDEVRIDYAKKGKRIPWTTSYLRNKFSSWNPIKDDFNEKSAHGS